MRIVTSNIQWGRGVDGRVDCGRIADAPHPPSFCIAERTWGEPHCSD